MPSCKSCRSIYMAQHYIKNHARERALRKAWYEKNKSVVSKQQKEKYMADPEKYKMLRKARIYGITKEQFQNMWDEQGKACAICRYVFDNIRLPYIDHCHTTNVVRGLLCSHCNTGFGLLQENIGIFQRAIEYAMKCKK